MSDIAIRVENLSKLYTIGRAQQRHDTLRDALVNALPRIARISRKGNDNSSNSSNSWQEETNLWALKDVSFEVKQGEVVGVIGRNGAGKSTLLKILSRITEPTSGRAEIHGRVGSLLEVGTGFHPELTGRENIYLNGAILGMHRHEIQRKFDEIVAFAEIERFLDTPVKRYSSGMYVRLAFAVAAHLEPEILLVDEVLAVGDVEFQKKCLGKVNDFATGGRTVFLVSHNMQVISQFCERGLLLTAGKAVIFAEVSQVVSEYLKTAQTNLTGSVDLRGCTRTNATTGSSRFQSILLLGEEVRGQSEFQVGERIRIEFECLIHEPKPAQFYQIRIRSSSGVPIFHWVDFDDSFPSVSCTGRDRVMVTLDRLLLYPGRYSISLWVGDRYGTTFDSLEDCISFDVVSGSMMPMRRQFYPQHGIIHQVPSWSRQEQK